MARRQSTGIDTTTKRRALAPRRDPYFHKLGKGRYLGYRKTKGGGSWVARFAPDGIGYKFHALGTDDAMGFENAVEAAREWFTHAATVKHGQDIHYTVADAVADYVRHLEVENSADAAHRAKLTLKKHLTPNLGKIELAELTTAKIKRWRDGLVKRDDDPEVVRRSKDTTNRVLSIAKAALNLAFRSGLIESDTAWRRVPAFRAVGENRKLFLTGQQVADLIEHASGAFKTLLHASVHTGARYGELRSAKVADLDVINGSLHLSGKTGPRACYLSDDALAFFKRITKDRLPTAYLLTKDDGEPWGKSHQHRPMRAAVQAAKLPRDTVLYSLRHYHISRALLVGIPAQVVAENCGTSIRMLETHYAKFMAADRRAMMNRVVL